MGLNDETTSTATFTAPPVVTEATALTFTLRVTDAGDLFHEDTVTVTVRPQPPVITSAASLTVAENQTAVATLTATDADTPVADLTWSIPANAAGGADRGKFTLSSVGVLAFASSQDFENPDDADTNGIYAVTVEVSDGALTDTVDLTVTLTNVNEAPTADAGADQTGVVPGTAVTLSGSGSDPDAGDTLSYLWTQTDASTVTLTDANAATATFTAPSDSTEPVTLTFTLRVTDAGDLFHEDTVTVTVQEAGTLVLNVGAIAGDDIINIAEKAKGFAISGDTGTEAGVAVAVEVGTATLSATSADDNGTATWSVSVPVDASYITGESVVVTVSAAKTGFIAPSAVERTLTVDLVAPVAPTYTAPGSLTVGAAITTMSPTGASGVSEYDAPGLPAGLGINAGTGVISGTPTAAATDTASVTVTVSDSGGNSATVSITFPAVAKGDQTLSGFSYSASSVTFGSAAPTLTAPGGAQGALSYAATPSTVCTVDAATGALTLEGVGSCEVTVTAAATANYNEATASYTVTVQTTGSLLLNLDTIAGDDVINIAEKADGFVISGDTGTEGDVSVTVGVGGTNLTATSSTSDPAIWSVNVPVAAGYITGTSVDVSVTASKAGYTSPSAVEHTLTVDLVAPVAPTYTAPGSLTVGAAITMMSPTGASGVNEYAASGLPAGLGIDASTGVISGTPTAAATATASVTVMVSDTAGNSVTVSITFPAVAKSEQTLNGFSYSASSVTFGSAAPTLTAPGGAQGALSYAASPSNVCTVEAATGALTLAGVGSCAVTVTAAATANYNAATDSYTVTVNSAGALTLNVDTIAGDDIINIAEKAAGFAISGNTGTEGDVSVTVGVGGTNLTATSSTSDPAIWSVNVPVAAGYITGTSVDVSVTASKAGYTSPSAVEHTLTVDLVAPTAPTYTAPGSLTVGAAITTMSPTEASGVSEYDAPGLPAGLSIDAVTGVISGTPTTAATDTASVTVTVSDTAGNSATVSITFPAVAKGEQTLSGFSYSSSSVTFGSAAPTVTAPGGAQGALSYTASPSGVCTVDAATGALTLAGVGSCAVTVTAAATANYNAATDSYTVTVQTAGSLVLNVDAVTGDDIINITKKGEGFAISGDTGSEAGVTVSVQVGATTLRTTSADESGTATWSVNVPADASYIAGASVDVTVSAAKTGFIAPSAVERTLTVDLTAPVAPSYTAPGSLKVGAAITSMSPTGASDVNEYSASGLPAGLGINAGTGVISGTPTAAATDTASVTVTVSDSGGNTDTVSITFPAVAKGDQTLSGFSYSASSVTFGSAAPTLTAPSGVETTLSYAASPSDVCTVNAATGALTLAGVGSCEVTVTAADTANYNEASASYTVTVQTAGSLVLNVDTIASDDTVNIAEKAEGFVISGDTGTEAGVSVTVQVGTGTLSATSTDDNGTATWSAGVPADASYITGTGVSVSVTAAKAGYTSPDAVQRALGIDLTAPVAPSYTAPGSLKVGAAITEMSPTGASGVNEYAASGLPTGLSINTSTGMISGTPMAAATATASVTVTVSDSAGNTDTVSITFPAVAKGEQTLSGFSYSASSVTFGSAAPTLTAPGGAQGALSYAASPSNVCTVGATTGALTLTGVGSCTVTVTAAATADYEEGSDTATVTVTVQTAGTLLLNLDMIAGDNTVNIAEKAAGFAISGDTGTEAGVAVTVQVGTATLSATSADDSGTATWSVDVPADTPEISGTSVDVRVTASKAGYTSPSAVERTLTVDLDAPEVESIVRHSPAASPTDEDSLVWRVTFSEAIANLDAADFAVTGTTATITVASVLGADVIDVTITGGDLTDLDGTVTLAFASAQNIIDRQDNALSNTTPTGMNDNNYVVDNTAPAMTIGGVPATSTAQILVSNSDASVTNSGATAILAQSITTGGHRNGYTVSQIEISMRDFASPRRTTVKLYSNSNDGQPQDLVATLVNPVTFTRGFNTFTAPSGTTLSRNTTYWIVLNEDISDVSSERVGYTTTTSKADTSSYGWSIGDKRLLKNLQTSSWGTSTFSVISLTVKGNFTSGSSPEFDDASLMRSIAENTAADVNVGAVIPAAKDTDSDDNLAYTMEGTDAASFNFNATTRQITTKAGVTYDFETKSSYSVTIKVSDGTDSDTVDVTITLTDVNEMPSTPAMASSLVSNLEQTPDSGSLPLNKWDVIQGFETGASSYTLTSVELRLNRMAGGNSIGVPSVKLMEGTKTASSVTLTGQPVTLTAQVAQVTSTTGENYTFTAPGSTTLSASTRYFIVVESVGTRVQWMTTASTSEDATPAAGWSIDDERWRRNAINTGNFTNKVARSQLLRINGNTTTSTNNAPAFDAASLTRSIAENTAADVNVGAVIPAATDMDSGDTLTYTMGGTDAASFNFNATTRQITTKAGVTYDFETKSSYSVIIKVSDETDSDTVDVTITLTDVNEPPSATPTLSIEVYPLSVPENYPDDDKANVVDVIITPSADFPTDQTITLAVSGTATEGTDYTIDDKTLILKVGDKDAYTGIIILSDTITEGDETVIITGSVAGNSFGTATLTIEDVVPDDIVPEDTTAPTVTSIERLTPSSSPTNSDTLIWQVTFSEDVTGVDAADFMLSGTTATLTVSTVTASSAYSVMASGGNLDALDGTVTLDFAAGQDIADIAGHALANTTPTGTNENNYVVDNAPTVTSIERLTPSSSPTNSDTLIWQVTFSEDVMGVDAADFELAGANAATLSVSTVTASTVFNVTASGGDLATLNSRVTLYFTTYQNITDTANNALANTSPTGTNERTYVVDNAPTVTIFSVPLTSTGPFTARFAFSEAVTGFTVGDITLTNATASSFFMTFNSSVYTVLITPTTDGAVTVDVAADVVMDATGNNNTAAVRASSTYDPSATLAGICGRTEPVRAAILAAIDDISVCDHVTSAHLSTVGPPDSLSLDSMRITTLAAGDFDGLTSLVTLNLFDNQLTSLPSGIFNDLTSLQLLYLNKNALTALPDGVFNNLTNLVSIWLQRNELTALPDRVFEPLRNLWGLKLHGNELNELPDRVFEPLHNLQQLQLHDNPGAPFSPTAVAQPDNGTVPDTGGMVTLDGSGSSGEAWGSYVTYSWALTSPTTGVTVDFDNNEIASPTVTIPALAGYTELTFTLTVTGRGAISGATTGVDTATVRVADGTAPRVASITRQSPTSSPTNADDPTWLVTFNEDVANVDAADFMLSGTTATLTVSTVTASSAYSVMASGGNLDALDGTVTLDFAAGQDIADIAGHALANTTPTGTNDNTYLVDNTVPTVTISGVPANSSMPFTATFTFSEGVTDFAATDIALGNGAASSFTGSAGDTAYTAVITPPATGTVTLDVAAGAAMDLAGNDNTAAARAISTYDSTYDPSRGICGRTGAVRTGILGLISGVSNCADVTTQHLAAIASTAYLDLNSKSITTLATGDFAGLTSLGSLWLNRNQLTSLPDGIFDELTGLTSLTLSRNSLTALPDDIFDNLTALKTLWLNSNNLSTLPVGIFDNLTVLTSLLLNDNQLATLPDGAFESLTVLTATGLRLQGNPGAPFSPTAVALPDAGTVAATGDDVMLDGSGSSGEAWGSNVTYSWALTSPATGVTVKFDNNEIASPTVTIPALAANTELTFTLTVTGRGGTNGIATATDTATVTVQTAESLALNVGAIAGDDIINIAEKAAGFDISGDTGTEAGVAVTVQVGTATLSATSADDSGTATWSVSVPADASYITGASVVVSVSAAKTGFHRVGRCAAHADGGPGRAGGGVHRSALACGISDR